jgi:hypothetical protein
MATRKELRLTDLADSLNLVNFAMGAAKILPTSCLGGLK